MNTQPIQMNEHTRVNQINIGQFLKKRENQIKAALPKHLTVDRMMRIAVTELRKIPKLRTCTAESLFGAIIQCSQLGLEPGSALGHAYLIPYGSECQFMMGYRGMIDLARRSGNIISINAQCVYKGDTFDFEYGLDEKLRHIPGQDNDRTDSNILGAYAIAKLKGGGSQIEVMFKNEIDKIRNRSKASGNGPWVTDYAEMAKKTVVRRMFKYLPVSIELANAIDADHKAEIGEQHNNIVIDGEYESIDGEQVQMPEQQEKKSDRMAETLEKKKKEAVAPEEPPAAPVLTPEQKQEINEFFGE